MATTQPSTVRAIFLPRQPEALVFDLRDIVQRGTDRGMTLFTDAGGRQVLAYSAPAGFVRYGGPEHSRMLRRVEVAGEEPCRA